MPQRTLFAANRTTTTPDALRNLPRRTPIASNSRPARLFRIATIGFAAIGIGLAGWFAIGLAEDLARFDQTRGGYEAPYTGWTGTPIDWAAADITAAGFARRGAVVDVTLDCTTGMIAFDLLAVSIPFRTLSDRAIAVHRPREACVTAGFSPVF